MILNLLMNTLCEHSSIFLLQLLDDDLSLDKKLSHLTHLVVNSGKYVCATSVHHAARKFHQMSLMALQYSPSKCVAGDVYFIQPEKCNTGKCVHTADYDLNKVSSFSCPQPERSAWATSVLIACLFVCSLYKV